MATRKGRRKKVFCWLASGKVFIGVHLPLVGGQRWCYEFSPPQKGLPGDGPQERIVEHEHTRHAGTAGRHCSPGYAWTVH